MTSARKAVSPLSEKNTTVMFYGVIVGVLVVGFAFNVYGKISDSSPSIDTFLDLVTTPKTSFCSDDGHRIDPGLMSRSSPNCLDSHGYRVVEGESIRIFQLEHEAGMAGMDVCQPVAELNTQSLKKLFNLKFVDSPSIAPPKQPLLY